MTAAAVARAQTPQVPPPTRDQAAVTLAAEALTALTGGQPIRDVRIAAGGEWLRNGQTHSGLVALEASGPWSSRLVLGGGVWREAYSLNTDGQPQGAWSGQDGTAHSQARHNSFVPAAWFFPALSPLGALADPHASWQFMGRGVWGGAAVDHIRYWRVAAAGSPPALNRLLKIGAAGLPAVS